MTTLVHQFSELPMMVRGPVELAVAITVCLGAAWWAQRWCGKRSAAFRAHLWLIGFGAALAWSAVRLGGLTIGVPVPVAVVATEPRPIVGAIPMGAGPRETQSLTREADGSAARQGPTTAVAGGAANAAGAKRTAAPKIEAARMDWPLCIGAIWLMGVGAILIRILAGAVMLKRCLRLTRAASPGSMLADAVAEMGPNEPVKVQVRIHPAVSSPLSFGIRTWWILFPPEAEHWNATQVRLVLAHELAHCERRDHLAILFIRLVTALSWFHPLAWFGLRRFRLLCESAADDQSLEQVEVSVYARELLHLVRELRREPAFLAAATLSIGAPATIRDRIAALLDSTKDRRKLSMRASVAMAAIAVAAAILLPGLRAVRAENAAAPAATPSVPAKLKSMPIIKSGTQELKITVRDEQGAPVKNAEFKPTGCRTDLDRGSWYSWNPQVAKDPVKTDETGTAILRIPAFAFEDMATSGITGTMSHPDFCLQRVEIPVLEDRPVTLKRGAKISVKMIPPAGASPDMKVCADLLPANGGYSQVEWRQQEGAAGVVAQLEPGSYTIRAVAFDGRGGRFFSAVTPLEAVRGESKELALTVSPGFTVKGKLSADVPRPITHGWVAARIASIAAGKEIGKELASWSVWTVIRADGTFELTEVPQGEIQIVAICDGYVSPNPPRPMQGISHGMTTPQVFDFSLADNVVVAMKKTGQAKVKVLTADGKPLAGAQVAFWPNQLFAAGSSLLGRGFDQEAFMKWTQIDEGRGSMPEHPAPSWTTTSDDEGWAVMPNLPEGAQSFLISAEAWEMPIMTTEYGQARRQGEIKIQSGEAVTAEIKMAPKGKTSLSGQAEKESSKRGRSGRGSIPGSRLTGDPYTVAAGKDLTGRVVDESGAPLAGVLVDAWTWCPGNETKTGQDGRFRLPEPGDQDGREIEVRFSLASFSPVHVTRQPVGALERDVVLPKRPYFEGVVRDSMGRSVANQLVRATPGEKEADGVSISSIWSETRTDAMGRYRLHVFPDTFRVEVRSKAGEVARLPDQEVARDEARSLDIALAPGLTFRAHLVDVTTGQPVPGVRLKHWQHPGIEGTSDAKGDLAISGMFPGEFEFEVDAEKLGYRRWWSPEGKNEWDRRTMEKSGWQRNFDDLHFLISPEAEPVRIEMEKGVRIRGIVRAPDGSAVKGATVAAAHTGTGNSLTGDTRFSVVSKDDGNFEILLPASNGVPYNLVVHDGAYGEWRNFANGVLPPIKTKPGEEMAGIDITLTTPCTVQGRVVDISGRPVANREVRAASSDKWENRYYFPTTRTKPDGTFELRYVRAGKQLVQVAPFWLDPTASPETASIEVEATPERAISDIVLTAPPAR